MMAAVEGRAMRRSPAEPAATRCRGAWKHLRSRLTVRIAASGTLPVDRRVSERHRRCRWWWPSGESRFSSQRRSSRRRPRARARPGALRRPGSSSTKSRSRGEEGRESERDRSGRLRLGEAEEGDRGSWTSKVSLIRAGSHRVRSRDDLDDRGQAGGAKLELVPPSTRLGSSRGYWSRRQWPSSSSSRRSARSRAVQSGRFGQRMQGRDREDEPVVEQPHGLDLGRVSEGEHEHVEGAALQLVDDHGDWLGAGQLQRGISGPAGRAAPLQQVGGDQGDHTSGNGPVSSGLRCGHSRQGRRPRPE